MKTAFIICGALAREVVAIVKKYDWAVDIYGIPAIDHMYPDRIAPDVARKFHAIREGYDRVLVVYGDCGSRGALDDFLTRHNLDRIDGPHCYEMFGGSLVEKLMEEEPGTFFLTDFLVRGFNGTIWRGLGLDRFPELRDEYFRNYRRIVYLSQTMDTALHAKAQEVAIILNLPIEVRFTGYGLLEERIDKWMRQDGK